MTVRNATAGALPALALVLALAGGVVAQETEPAAAYQQGFHIVRPGDTLEGITRKYLGSSSRWRENWRLNPDVEDPNVLRPGERLRVLLELDKTVPTAQLLTVSGRVEERPAPIPWSAAQREDLLVERDSLRTFSRASSGLAFQDGTQLVVTEDTVIFLHRAGSKLGGLESDRKQVEIVEGQADLEARLDPASGSEVEILVGGTRALSQLDDEGRIQTRARRAQAGGAQVMVYEGGGEVEAAGQKVQVARGMGTSVPDAGPPAPPEELLPAPELLSPPAGAELSFNRPRFLWDPVEGAATYVVEVCRDAGCAALVERQLGLETTAWQPAGLEVAPLFWRVTAVSPSGLDGYPSPGSPFAVLSAGDDTIPPTADIAVAGNRTRRGSTLYVDRNATFEVAAADAESGLARWLPVVNGAPVSLASWQGEWSEGSYEATIRAIDQAGNTTEAEPVVFVVDTSEPEVRFDAHECGRAGVSRVPHRLRRRWLRDGWEWLEWSVDCVDWQPLFWAPSAAEAARRLRARGALPGGGAAALQTFAIESDAPQFFLRSASGRAFGPAAGSGSVSGSTVRVTVHDRGAGVERVRVATLGGGSSHDVALEAADTLGHATRLQWQLAR